MTKPGPSVTSGADTQPGSDSLFPSGFGGGAAIRTGGVGTGEIADGSVAAADLNLPSVAAAIAARSELTSTYAAKPQVRRGFTPPANAVSTMISAMQAGHAWAASGAGLASSNLNDTTAFALGTQSVSVTTTGTAANCDLDLSGLALDTTSSYIRIWLRVSDFTKLASITLYTGDTALTNHINGGIVFGPPTYSDLTSSIRSGEWAVFDIARGDLSGTVGTPTLSNIQRIKLRTVDRGTGAVTVNLGGIALVPNASSTFPNGVISLCFDDTYAAAWSTAKPKLDVYGYAGTLFPIIETVGQASRLTLAQIQSLQNLSGWEVGGHASTVAAHVAGNDSLTDAQMVTECETALAWMDANDLRGGQSWAWPNGTSNTTCEAAVKRYFRTARSTYYRTLETYPWSNPMRLRAINVGGLSLATMKAYVDNVKAGKSWGIFLFHDLVASGASGNNILQSDFNSLIDYINGQGVAVRTISQVTR